jgi:hypothetical protein
MAYVPTRTNDDRILALLELRAGGGTLAAIAARFGLSPARIAQMTDPVRKADMAESGEDAATVARHYWPVRG